MIEHSHHIDRDTAAFALALLRGGTPSLPGERAAPRIAEGLRRSGLTAIVLGRLPAGAAPEALRASLEAERSRLRADLALLYDRFSRLATLLDGVGVPFILLKGGALAPLLYESPELRPMVDVDLLIRRSDWPAARDAMQRDGYSLPGEPDQAYWLANYFNLAVSSPEPGPVHFDIHWSLAQPIRYRVDVDGLWARAAPLVVEGRPGLRLGNEDLLLSLILHLAYHYFDARLLWLYDIHRLCRKVPIDWDAAARRSRQWGMRTVFGLGLSYVEKVFPGSVPAEVLRAAAAGPIRRVLLAPLRSGEVERLFRGDDRRVAQLVQGLLVMDRPLVAARFGLDKIARRVRFLGARPRLR